jgi:hypothetical protein
VARAAGHETIEARFSSGFAEDAQNSPHTVLRILRREGLLAVYHYPRSMNQSAERLSVRADRLLASSAAAVSPEV